MDHYDFFRQIAWGVHTDTSLQQWAVQHFSDPVLTYFGHFPSEYRPPYMVWDLPTKGHGQQLREQIWGFSIFMEISRDDYKTSSEKNFIEPEGVELILDMLTLVKAAIVTALPDGIWGEFNNDEQMLSVVPSFFAVLDVRFDNPLTFPNDPMG